MINLKSHLQMARFHTAPLEFIPAVVGAALAVNTIYDINVLLWGVFGLLYHTSGYYANSYYDWINEFDKDQKEKSHFPLNTGSLSPLTAKQTTYSLLIITAVYGILITYHNLYALIGMFAMPVFGMSYNLIGKYTQFKFILIAISHTLVIVVPYIALGGNNLKILLYLSLYIFLMIIYQISIEGEIKDMNTDEENFLINHGARYMEEISLLKYDSNFVGFPFWIKGYAHFLKLLTAIIGASITRMLGGDIYLQLTVFWIVVIASLIFGTNLLRTGEYNRQNRIRNMAIIELLTLSALLVAVIPVIGLYWSIILFTVSVVWVLFFNKIEWGTWISPDV